MKQLSNDFVMETLIHLASGGRFASKNYQALHKDTDTEDRTEYLDGCITEWHEQTACAERLLDLSGSLIQKACDKWDLHLVSENSYTSGPTTKVFLLAEHGRENKPATGEFDSMRELDFWLYGGGWKELEERGA